jgi:2-oxoisovalerate dehydrogenase E1 component
MALEALTRYLERVAGRAGWKQIVEHSWGDSPLKNGHHEVLKAYHPEITIGDLFHVYRTMIVSRKLDDRELMLQRQGQAWFSASCAGKEAALCALGLQIRPTDPLWGYYRDRALILMRGMTPREMLMASVASAGDPSSGGRQMPEHWSDSTRAICPYLSPVGANVIPAAGLAEAIQLSDKLLDGQGRYPGDSVVYTATGDGTTAEGEVYEGLRAAMNARAPLLFHLMDDGFGISVPVSEQVPGGNLGKLFSGWPGLTYLWNEGLDFRRSYDTFKKALEICRSGRGPVMVHSKVLRLYSHSSTDDMRKYRPREDCSIEIEERDPVVTFAREIVEYGIASPSELQQINADVDAEILRAVDDVLNLPKTDVSRFMSTIYNYDPPKAQAAYAEATKGQKSPSAGKTLVMADAINASLNELMEVRPDIVMWGEDVADLSKEHFRRNELEGKGGVFGITKGLQRKYGPDRVSNSPIAEASIVGRASGWSIQGFLPIVEVQFRDYLSPAWQQLVDQVGTLRWRSDGRFSNPLVIRMAYGGYLGGAGAIWHSESANGPILHYPGIRLCVPSNAEDAAGLMRAAAFCGDPVVYCESKSRYRFRDEFMERKYPDWDFVLWPGTSRRYGDGKDIAILTYGTSTTLCFRAMQMLEADGIRARMIDLCWLNPLDTNAIRSAADDCGLVLIVDEDRRTCGAGAAIADVIYRDRDLRRRVDVERIATKDCRVSYGPVGERAILPQADEILRTARDLIKSRKR